MILVTGATGNIGSELVKLLLLKKIPIRVITRGEKKVSHLDPGIERVIGDRQDPAVVSKALQGADQVFILPVLFDKHHGADRLLIEQANQPAFAKW